MVSVILESGRWWKNETTLYFNLWKYRAFVNRLLAYADQQDTPSTWEAKEIHDNSVFEQEDEPYVVLSLPI